MSAFSGFATVLADQMKSFPNAFFAMDTAMVRTLGTPLHHSDIQALAELRYKGLGAAAMNESEWSHLVQHVIPWLDGYHLKLYAAYGMVDVQRGGFTVSSGIKRNIAALRGRGTFIWLLVRSKDFGPSDPAGDQMAVEAIRSVADEAARAGCSVSIYPHFGLLVQRVADAVRLCDKANRGNLSVTFNLCHWLRTDGPASMDSDLKLAKPHLSLVTINGANRNGKNWKQLIQPLGQGDFDLSAFLRALQSLDYRGPIGLQGYDVANNFHIAPIENLRRSMAAWNRLVAHLQFPIPR